MTFELIFTALATLFTVGIYTDGWAHNHIPTLESFFTPWHAILYGGYALTGGFLAFTLIKNRRAGLPWKQCLPYGYWTSFLGAVFFFLSGLGDMAWHIAFGIEHGTEALFSPTHLGLATGAALMLSGPFRAAWKKPGVSAPWLAIISLTLCVSVVSFMTQFAHPIRVRAAGPGPVIESMKNDGEALGASGVILQTLVLAGASLTLARRWKTPFGAHAVMFGANMFGMAFMNDQQRLFFGAVLAGLAIDWFVSRKSGPIRAPRDLRLLGFLVPAVYGLFYFLTLIMTGGIWWTIHLWTGAIVMSGIGGYLLACAMSLPDAPAGI